jgi:hypothetical protein
MHSHMAALSHSIRTQKWAERIYFYCVIFTTLYTLRTWYYPMLSKAYSLLSAPRLEHVPGENLLAQLIPALHVLTSTRY